MNSSKVKICIGDDSFEIEGSEEFVAKHLNDFKELLASRNQNGARRAKKKILTREVSTPENDDSGQEKKIRVRSKAKAKKLMAERFDIHGGEGKPSLKKFFEQKNPGKANGPRIAAIGYYITEILGEKNFTEGQVEYAYKMLDLTRPNHLHQIMINNKNDKDYYEQMLGEESCWQLTRSGEIFVADGLPTKTNED